MLWQAVGARHNIVRWDGRNRGCQTTSVLLYLAVNLPAVSAEGAVCPYTFVKSKLAPKGIDPGRILKITVDNSESASNVPRSPELERHEVLEVILESRSVWSISVEKGSG